MSNPTRCAACRYLRRRCCEDCALAPYFPSANPHRFACVHRIFGASNVARMLQRSIDRDVVVDLESGMNALINQREGSKDVDLSAGQGRRVMNKGWGGLMGIDGFMNVEEAVKSANIMTSCSALPLTNAEASGDKRDRGEESLNLLEKKVGAEKTKKKGCKKPPKPPRPPKSPPLDAADQKLIREISELAMMKRARIERMKQKMKNAKSTSSNGNLCALVVTILFCLVIIWQGAFSGGNSTAGFHGSPESSLRIGSGLISVRFHKNASENGRNMPDSATSNNAEPVS